MKRSRRKSTSKPFGRNQLAALRCRHLSCKRIVGWIVVAVLSVVLTTANVSAQTPPPYAPDSISVPPDRPSAMLGAPIYQQNCAFCHGMTGAGDGSQSAPPGAVPQPINVPAHVWELAPAVAFHVTKYGSQPGEKPAFQNFLNDIQLWQATFYAWSLHTSADQVAAGMTIYTEQCASCHGGNGRGDGPEAGADLRIDFADLRAMNVRSPASLDNGWRAAHAEIGADLSEAERNAVLDAIRTFTYAPPWESPYQRGGEGVIEGRLVQGSEGAGLPVAQEVSLMAYMNFTPVSVFTATTGADGAFTFDRLKTGSDVVYYVGTTYEEVAYGSDLFALSPVTPSVEIEIPIYETTADAGQLRFSRVQWVIDHAPGALRVRQFLSVANDLDRTVVGQAIGESERAVTVALPVPATAVDLEFQDGALGARYIGSGDRIYDSTPIHPGAQSRQIMLAYSIPYADATASFAAEIPYPVDALGLLIADLPGLSVDVSESLESVGNQTVQDIAYRVWNGTLPTPGAVEIALENLIPAGGADPRLTQAQRTPLIAPPVMAESGPPIPPLFAGLAIGAVVLVIGAGILYWIYARDKVQTLYLLRNDKERLLTEIASLDDRHARGEMDDETWSAERLTLMRSLHDVTDSLEQMQPSRKYG